MSLSTACNEEIGRLLNGTSHPQSVEIAHLATAAGRAADFLEYLADVDSNRFAGIWPKDGYCHDAVSDGHVRSATSACLTSLDLCIAAAGRISQFSLRPPRGEDSIRTFYSASGNDRRKLVPSPWRAWLDAVVSDPKYETVLNLRNSLVHADIVRTQFATTMELNGHGSRPSYNLGPLAPVSAQSHTPVGARQAIELCREFSCSRVGAFVSILQSLSDIQQFR